MLVLVGSSYRSAPVTFRERLSSAAGECGEILDRLVAAEGIREALVISTCNRFEVLIAIDGDAKRGVAETKRLLVGEERFTSEELARYCYELSGRDAVRHLFRVASGLDSMILGEPQILGQVKQAYHLARERGTTGPQLEPLMQRCLKAAKRARHETGISRNPVSVAYTAVQLAGNIFGELSGRNALLLGSGKMAGLVAKHLLGKGVSQVYICSRTYDNALSMAEKIGGHAVHWDDGLERLADVDIVVSCTAAPGYVLSKKQFADRVRKRRGTPLFLIDIAVPRDIDPEVNKLKNVYLYDIDGLQGVVDSNLQERKAAAQRAEELIDDDVNSYDRWRQTSAVKPIVVSLRETLHQLGQAEVARARRHFGEMNEQQERAVEQLASGLIGKLLHLPIRHLKAAAQRGQVDQVHQLYNQLFGIDADKPAAAETKDEERPLGPRRALRGGKDS